TAYGEGKILPGKEILSLDVDILITAAIPDLIKKEDVEKIKAKLIVQGSNIPTTPETEEELHKKGILVVPDFVANAGGVISSYAEYKGKTKEEMFKLVEKKIRVNTEKVLKLSKQKGIKPRDAAMEIAVERVKSAI
ncbi:MAG TPA: Glu/Leu/Phe/Val dehydrogenase, partial [archaeon]|nr:Glu/Leu/Phe/Val dehydrogenase [archaeon]